MAPERTRGAEFPQQAEAILALALEHHIAIGRNVPLPMLLDWMVGLSDRGVVEFVPKSDPAIQRMLSTRQDIFDQYSQAEFESELAKRASIEQRGGRLLLGTDALCLRQDARRVRKTFQLLLSIAVLAVFSGVAFVNFYRLNLDSLAEPFRAWSRVI